MVADVKAAERWEMARQAPCAGCRKDIPEGEAIQWRRVGESFRWHRACLPGEVQARLEAN